LLFQEINFPNCFREGWGFSHPYLRVIDKSISWDILFSGSPLVPKKHR
jgi:hypothetical protein